MIIFLVLYFIVIIYCVVLRLSIRRQVQESGSVGLIYKIQSATVLLITGGVATALNCLFAETVLDWLPLYLPSVICGLTLLVRPRA